jgi:hypothetical protein
MVAIGNVMGVIIEPKSSKYSIPKKGNPLVAREHKIVRVSKKARPKIKNGCRLKNQIVGKISSYHYIFSN